MKLIKLTENVDSIKLGSVLSERGIPYDYNGKGIVVMDSNYEKAKKILEELENEIRKVRSE